MRFGNTSLDEFCHLMADLIEGDITLGEALRLTGDGVRDSTLTRACQEAARSIEAGASLSSAVSRQREFPARCLTSSQMGRGESSLPEALRMLGEMFEKRGRHASELGGDDPCRIDRGNDPDGPRVRGGRAIPASHYTHFQAFGLSRPKPHR